MVSILIIGKLKWKGILIISIAFIISFASYTNYFNNVGTEKLRITKVNTYSTTAVSKGRKYDVISKNKLCEGDIIKGKFEFSKAKKNDQGIVASVKLQNYTITKDLKSKLINFKEEMSLKLISRYGYDKGTLMSSLVLGTGSQIYSSRKESMENLGLMHILSISGFHIGLIVSLLSKIRIKKLDFIIIFGYIYFIGSVPAYRVLYTILYKKLGKFLKRDPDLITGIFFALFIQSIFKPYLLFSIGFILTYFATLGIIMFKKSIEKYLVNFRISQYVVDNLSTTIAALSLTIPFISILDSSFSLSVLIGSIFVVPVYIIITYLSFLALLFIDVKIIIFLLEPFINVIFEFSYHLGIFLGKFKMTTNLIYSRNLYAYFLFLAFIFIYKNKPKIVASLGIIFLIISLPLVNEITIINKFGNPYVRISHNFRVYDIMDSRNNKDSDMIELNEKLKIKIKDNTLVMIKQNKKNEIPKIYFNNIMLKIKNPDYILGEVVIARYIIYGERLIRVK